MVAFSILMLVAAVSAHDDSVVEGDECTLMHQTRVVRTGSAFGGGIVSFPEFIAQHGRTYLPGSDEYTMRAALFEARVTAVQEQNSDSSRQWTAGINKLADRTTAEMKALRGYNRHRRAGASVGSAASGRGSSPLAFTEFEKPRQLFAEQREILDLNWADTLSALSEVQDQGGCGSCWAFAASTVLRAQSEIHTTRRDFSPQELVSCIRNPEHCGGEGGCEGATVELAMDYALRYGSFTEQNFPYIARDLRCPSETEAEMQSQVASVHKGEAYGMVGWMRLPENKLLPVKQALVSHGPVGVSLMVDDLFQLYETGILPACQPEALINHAVALVGFGEEPATALGPLMRYWRIQNSWGGDWGEGGYVRIFRHDDSAEEAYCGWDDQPEIGSGCDGGPERVWVCGSCGILNDVVTPIFRGGPSHKADQEPGSMSKDVVLAQASATVARH